MAYPFDAKALAAGEVQLGFGLMVPAPAITKTGTGSLSIPSTASSAMMRCCMRFAQPIRSANPVWCGYEITLSGQSDQCWIWTALA